jgi:hypothetical protein
MSAKKEIKIQTNSEEAGKTGKPAEAVDKDMQELKSDSDKAAKKSD